MNTAVYDIITERIVSMLQAGTCPWRRPWNLMPIAPQNFATGRRYSGINLFLLSVIGYEVPLFLTFMQVSERGGTVKKGSKGVPVVYWGSLESEELNAEGAAKKIHFLRYYTVFNAHQIDGVPFPKVQSRAGTAFDAVAAAEAVVSNWRHGPVIEHGFRQAGYLPAADVIQMPSPGSFDSPAHYYATLFHELAHSTGHGSRLDRKLSTNFGREDYSREELIAEMTSAFLCAHCGIDNSVIDQQAAYLAGWLKALKADLKLVIAAASQAQKAANMILEIMPVEQAATVEAAA